MKIRLYGHGSRLLRMLSSLFLVFCALSRCAMVGPKSISMGRADYNDALTKTEDV